MPVRTPFDNDQESLALTQLLITGTGDSLNPLGAIRTFGFNFALGDTVAAQGQMLSIAETPDLFDLIATLYGGDGDAEFGIPDLTHRTAIGAGQGFGLSNYELAAAIGSDDVTLSNAQLPASLGGGNQPFDNRQLSLPLTYLINAHADFPGTTGNVGLTGEIVPYAGNTAPFGWLEAAGQALPIADYVNLFGVIGTTYGGDGIDTFNLPDLRGRTPIGASFAQPAGTYDGDETTVILTGNLPIVDGGSATPVENRGPSLAVTALVATQGLFPSPHGETSVASGEWFLGEIVLFAGPFVPGGWMEAAGQLVPIFQNTPLFSLFGPTYGGDGRSTFALPDLRGRAIVGTGWDAEIGQVFGMNETVLTAANVVADPYLWSTLVDGAGLAFTPAAHMLLFDDGSISASDVGVSSGSVILTDGDKTVTLVTDLRSITTSNVQFADGSVLAVGDNTTATAFDDGGNLISGGPGDDQLLGLGGDDTLHGGAGADRLDGSSNTDSASYNSAGAAVVANLTTPSQNTGAAAGDTYVSIEGLIGSAFADALVGDGNANTLQGGLGDDYLQARGGADTLLGGDGSDRLEGGAGGDSLQGGAGTDYAVHYYASSAVSADLAASASNQGDAAGDTYLDVEGFIGSQHADTLSGNDNVNHIVGLGGADILAGRGANDYLAGMDGDDTLNGGAGADGLDGGAGTDHASYAGATAGVLANLAGPAQNTGEAAGDGYLSIEGLTGSSFDDVLVGNDSANDLQGGDANDYLQGRGNGDTLFGGAGNDRLEGGAGGDVLDGGDGFDYAVHYYAASGVEAILSSSGLNADAGGDSYVSIEGLIGSAHDDVLFGDGGANLTFGLGGDHILGLGGDNHILGLGGDDHIGGLGGDDYLAGMDGEDTLEGGAGADTLNGGAGNDTFVFYAGEANGDSIVDFTGNGAAAGDSLLFNGYGSAVDGATFVQLDVTHGQITSANGLIQETIAFQNAVTIDAQDYTFV
ncbi:MAG TPA: tail fiber protein [Burkholderiales bacterium]|nr:tail fiber protein [Burkholderiales bacterium]